MRHESYDDYLDASAPLLPHSFILLPGPATHGSNLPLQHHLVTTAVIQEAFTQMNEWGKKNQPLLMVLLPPCNTTLILWMVSQSCLLPPQSWSGGFYNLHTDNQHEKSAFLHSSSFNHYFSPQTGRPFLNNVGQSLH